MSQPKLKVISMTECVYTSVLACINGSAPIMSSVTNAKGLNLGSKLSTFSIFQTAKKQFE